MPDLQPTPEEGPDPWERWGQPAALALAALASLVGPLRFLLEASVGMELHEVGHALVAWLGGQLAIPLPMVTLTFSEERSFLVFAAVFALLAWLRWVLLREECLGLARVLLVLFLAQGLLSLVVGAPLLRGLVVAGGQAGELVLGALLVALFSLRFPAAVRWHAARWFFLACGAAAYVLAMRKWWRARTDPDAIPWGSFFGGDGDLEHLQEAFGWSAGTIISLYLSLGIACGAALVCLWILQDSRRTRPAGRRGTA